MLSIEFHHTGVGTSRIMSENDNLVFHSFYCYCINIFNSGTMETLIMQLTRLAYYIHLDTNMDKML